MAVVGGGFSAPNPDGYQRPHFLRTALEAGARFRTIRALSPATCARSARRSAQRAICGRLAAKEPTSIHHQHVCRFCSGARFDPNPSSPPPPSARHQGRPAISLAEIEEQLPKSVGLARTKTGSWRLSPNLVQATIRTQICGQIRPGRAPRPVISFKVEARKIAGLPAPAPRAAYELFRPFARRVEGIHLSFGQGRCGAPAGLRWVPTGPQDFPHRDLAVQAAQAGLVQKERRHRWPGRAPKRRLSCPKRHLPPPSKSRWLGWPEARNEKLPDLHSAPCSNSRQYRGDTIVPTGTTRCRAPMAIEPLISSSPRTKGHRHLFPTIANDISAEKRAIGFGDGFRLRRARPGDSLYDTTEDGASRARRRVGKPFSSAISGRLGTDPISRPVPFTGCRIVGDMSGDVFSQTPPPPLMAWLASRR